MYDYSERIEAFRDERVRLTADFREKLLDHRKANRDRLMNRLPDFIKGVRLNESDFKPQGSFAMGTVIQNRFTADEYDIDDGVVLWKHELVDKDGVELTAMQVREKVRKALEFHLFNRQPKLFTNCVRVFYAEQDAEKHHVDFPVYRRFYNAEMKKVRELASEDQWVFSDPTQVSTRKSSRGRRNGSCFTSFTRFRASGSGWKRRTDVTRAGRAIRMCRNARKAADF